MGVTGLPTDFATVRSQSVTPETRVKLAKPDSYLRQRPSAAGADLELTSDRGERPVSGKALTPLSAPERALNRLNSSPVSWHSFASHK